MPKPTIPRGTRLLGVTEAARFLGLSKPGFLKRDPPEPDAMIGNVRGWTEETLRSWDHQVAAAQTRTPRRRSGESEAESGDL